MQRFLLQHVPPWGVARWVSKQTRGRSSAGAADAWKEPACPPTLVGVHKSLGKDCPRLHENPELVKVEM